MFLHELFVTTVFILVQNYLRLNTTIMKMALKPTRTAIKDGGLTYDIAIILPNKLASSSAKQNQSNAVKVADCLF